MKERKYKNEKEKPFIIINYNTHFNFNNSCKSSHLNLRSIFFSIPDILEERINIIIIKEAIDTRGNRYST